MFARRLSNNISPKPGVIRDGLNLKWTSAKPSREVVEKIYVSVARQRPLILTWVSLRARKRSSPSGRYLTRSPVR
ncbi:unnamed protein product [Penicillium salamii]|nr:unnamed protein product [Penicillium salamii]